MTLEDSLRILRSGRTGTGAILASPSFPVYRYSWLRDGAFIAEAFHRWAAETALRYAHKVEALERGIPEPPTNDHVLHPRYTADGEEVDDPLWSDFQLDGHGFWLAALARHARAGIADPADLRDAVDLTVRYLSLLWDHPCADCWEESDGRRHPTTLCAVAAGLLGGADLLDDSTPVDTAKAALARVRELGLTADGSLAKHEGVEEVDGSALLVLGSVGPFEPDDPILAATLGRVEADLVADGGGVHRYLDDGYYGGGLWVVLSGALARVHALAGNVDRARDVLAWVEGTADEDGAMPEQVPTHLRKPDLLSVWESRWGPVARPLLWSHAMHVLARDALSQPEPPISS